MKSYKKLEDKLMELRLPLPQKRLAMARTVQRAATAVGHHHFAQLTEVACGRIEAELKPKEEERSRKNISKGERGERGERRQKVKKRSKRSKGNEGVDGGEEEGEEHFASGALEPQDHENHDDRGDEGFVLSPEDRGRMISNVPRQLSPAEDHSRELETQHQPHGGGMRRQFGQPWPTGGPPSHEDHPSRRKRSSQHSENHRPSHNSGRSRREHEQHGRHPHPEKHPHYEEKPRRLRSKERHHNPHRRRHTHERSPSPPPKKEKLTWKVLLRGFIKGVAAYEMNELEKKQAATQPQPPTSGPSPERRRRRSEPSHRPPRSRTPNPSRPRSSRSNAPPPRPRLLSRSPSPRGRPGLRHASSAELPPLTPDQIHWREVRAREQGQADIMRAKEEAAARPLEQEHQHQPDQVHGRGKEQPLTYGEDPFADLMPNPSPGPTQRNPALLETVAATVWSFPADLNASSASSADPAQAPASPPVQTSNTTPPKWGDQIKERQSRQKRSE